MLNNLTLDKTAKLLKAKKISSVELTNFYLKRINKFDIKVKSLITVDEEQAIFQARASDKRRQGGQEWSHYDGVPMAIKDVLVTKDFPTTAGSRMLENFQSPYDATVVRKLLQSGCVVIGKTNLDEFAMGSSTENSAYKITRNPWDLERVPGGSSGGSAAAVSADFVGGALGSDTGGSIRQPASLCGIVGLKPTYGTVSRYGLIAMASSLDQVGPMTKTVGDAEALFNLIKGADINDATSQTEPARSTGGHVAKVSHKNSKKIETGNLSAMRVGIPKEYFVDGMSAKVRETVERAISLLKNLKAKLVDISLPHTRYALSVYYILMSVEVASNLARYDGIRFGLNAEQIRNPRPSGRRAKSEIRNYIEEVQAVRAAGFGPEVKRRIILGTFVSSAGYAEKYYLQAQKVRALIKQDFDQVFDRVDLITTPVSPTPAFKIGAKINDPLSMYLSDIFTIPVNLAGLPAISIPCGFVNEGQNGLEGGKKLPVGLQLIAPQFGEELLFKAGIAFEQETEYEFKSPLY